jgi:hypothetical protein
MQRTLMQTKTSKDERRVVHKPLPERTLDYWRVSSVWEGRGGQMQVGEALEVTWNIAMTSNPHSKLAEMARKLESDIIHLQK